MKRYLVLKGSPITPQYLRQPKQGPTGPKQGWTLHGPAAVELDETDANYELRVAGGALCGAYLKEVQKPAKVKTRVSIVGVNPLLKEVYFFRKHRNKHYYFVTPASMSRVCRAAFAACWLRDVGRNGSSFVEYWIK